VTSVKYTSLSPASNENNTLVIAKEYFFKFLDTKFSKKIMASTLILKDKLTKQSKNVKNIVFLV